MIVFLKQIRETFNSSQRYKTSRAFCSACNCYLSYMFEEGTFERFKARYGLEKYILLSKFVQERDDTNESKIKDIERFITENEKLIYDMKTDLLVAFNAHRIKFNNPSD
jgi:hypothetical protein